MSEFPLSNQIILAIPWTWLLSGAERSGPAHSEAVLTKPGQMLSLLFCKHICAEVWMWESSFQQCLLLVSGALWHFHQGSRWWQRDDPHYDCRSPKFKCKCNSSLQGSLNLKWSCQLGTMVVRNTIKLVRTTAALCIKKNSPLHKARHKIYAIKTSLGSQHHFCSQQAFYMDFISFFSNWYSKSSLLSSRFLFYYFFLS